MTFHLPSKLIEEWRSKPYSLVFLVLLVFSVAGLTAKQVEADSKLDDFEKKFQKIEKTLKSASDKADTNGLLLEKLARLAIAERIAELKAEECEGDNSKRAEIEELQEEYREVNDGERYPEPDCR